MEPNLRESPFFSLPIKAEWSAAYTSKEKYIKPCHCQSIEQYTPRNLKTTYIISGFTSLGSIWYALERYTGKKRASKTYQCKIPYGDRKKNAEFINIHNVNRMFIVCFNSEFPTCVTFNVEKESTEVFQMVFSNIGICLVDFKWKTCTCSWAYCRNRMPVEFKKHLLQYYDLRVYSS